MTVSSSLSADADPAALVMSDFAYGAELTSSSSELRRFVISPVIIKDIRRRDLGDIRVYDGNNSLMPTLVRKKDGDIAFSQQGLSIKPDRTRGKITGYILDRTSKHEPSLYSLQLKWKRGKTPNIGSLRVEHSADKKTWIMLSGLKTVTSFNFEGIRLIRNSIDINKQTERYIRLTVTNKNQQPPLASAIATSSNRTISDSWWIHAGKLQPLEGKPDSYQFSIREGIRPVSLKLLFPKINSILSGSLYSIDNIDGKPQRKRVAKNFLSYTVTLNNTVANSRPFDISQWQSPDWLIVADSAKNIQADNLPGVLLAYPQYEVIFANAGDEPYTAVWGNPAAGPPVSGNISERIKVSRASYDDIGIVKPGAIIDNAKLTEIMESRNSSWLELLAWLVAAAIAVLALRFGYRRFLSG